MNFEGFHIEYENRNNLSEGGGGECVLQYEPVYGPDMMIIREPRQEVHVPVTWIKSYWKLEQHEVYA